MAEAPTAIYPSAWTPTTTAKTDPLAGLHTPSVTKFPEIKDIVISDFSDQIDEMREAMKGVVAAAEKAAEAMPKVVQCYECENFAFAGTTTLMEVRAEDDDHGLGGAKPFCPDCVRAIEKRSRKSEPVGLGSVWINDQMIGGLNSIDYRFDYNSPQIYGTFTANSTNWDSVAKSLFN